MVKALAASVALREGPTLNAGLVGYLPEGSRSFVVSGPVLADGYEWVLLSGPGLPPASGCATFTGPELNCPVWLGWAATGDPETGDPWFAEDPTDCPDPAAGSRAIMLLGDIEALHCYGDRQLELTGWLPAGALNDPYHCVTEIDSLAWLYCPQAFAATVFAAEDDAVAIEVFVEPGSGAEFTSTDYWPIVMGHLDDPAAQSCDEAIYPGHPIWPQRAVLDCRARFVADRLAAVAP